jgi:hypothetical protein
MADQTITAHRRCLHLRCKSMLVYGENFESDPEFQAGMIEFWCLRTSQALGPDGEEASLLMCSNPERNCYEEF